MRQITITVKFLRIRKNLLGISEMPRSRLIAIPGSMKRSSKTQGKCANSRLRVRILFFLRSTSYLKADALVGRSLFKCENMDEKTLESCGENSPPNPKSATVTSQMRQSAAPGERHFSRRLCRRAY